MEAKGEENFKKKGKFNKVSYPRMVELDKE